eukprot:TRINITY_DN15293_c0_g1_i1.p1 TRINITY_DN15293_c0_g1~~TRINITY_DN15293_c0_g1_i1.p1  ORF type:complete len:601 (+),score=78.66 TRINITY_DN15293_c0_g1_i1:381-2183(+)
MAEEKLDEQHPLRATERNSTYATETPPEPSGEDLTEDEYLERIGGWGRYQCLNTIISWMAAAVVSCHVMVMYYVHLPAEVKCMAGNCGIPDGCPSDPDTDDFCKSECTAGYVAQGWGLKGESLYNYWDLTCSDDKWLVPLSDSAFFLGWLLGGVTCGRLGDLYGRRRPLAAYIVLTGGALSLTTVATSMEMFIPLKFLHGFFVGPLLLTNYVYGSEFIPQKNAALFGSIYFMIAAAGSACLAILAWQVPDWKKFSWIVSFITVPFCLWPLFGAESPMWLLSVGKADKAQTVFNSIARMNGKPIPDNHIKCPPPEEADDEPTTSAFTLITTPKVRVITLSMMFVWLAASLCYFGLGLSGATLPGDSYFNAALLSMLELPVYPLQLLAVDNPYLGRKKTMIFSLLIGGCCCFATIIPLDGVEWSAFAGNMFMTAAFTTTYVWAAEIFPADVRASGLGLCTAGGKMGSVVTPFIVDLGSSQLSLAMGVFGTVAFVGVLASFAIPETRGKPSYQSIAEMLGYEEGFTFADDDVGLKSMKTIKNNREDDEDPFSTTPSRKARSTLGVSRTRMSLPLPNGRPKSALGGTVTVVSDRCSMGHPFLSG